MQRLAVPLLGTTLAYLIWAVCPLAICSLVRLPLLEMATLTLGSGGLVALAVIWREHGWRGLLHVVRWSFVPAAFIVAEQLSYFSAFRYAPPHHVDFLNYLWPIFCLIGSALMLRQRLRPWQMAGGVSCFLGITLLLGPALIPTGFSALQWFGYLLAVGGALFSALYALWMQRGGGSSIGFQFLFAALFMALLHLCGVGEKWIAPTTSEGVWLICLGVTNYGLAYPLWTWSLRRGQFVLLSMLSYPTALISTVLMILVGLVELSVGMAVASLLITIGYWMAHGFSFGRKRALRVPLEQPRSVEEVNASSSVIMPQASGQ